MNKQDSGGTMSEQQVLPPLDVTEEDRASGFQWTQDMRTDGINLRNEVDARFCRERQLLTALASLAQSEAERERLQGELAAATAEIARLKRKVYFGNCKEFYGSPEGSKS